ncbi:MAG: 50S ribosomal protein L9 [Patescibacteria group bacterium]|nr:50S ribosomal protein L9 [Patescibacteria group bacterium]
MKVIFLKDVPRVGKRHDIKEVNDGYAMNFLLPRKLVEMATAKAVAELELRKKNIEIEREVQTDLLMKNLEELKGKVLHMSGRTDDKGHLFSGIHRRDIVDAMQKEYHASIDEGAIKLEKPIKEVGEYEILVDVNGKKSSFKLIVE